MRSVATEMGATTGLLTHYFPNKQALVGHALTLLDERRAARPRPVAPEGIAGLRAALLDVLPLTPQAAASNRIWVGSWDAALAAPDLAAGHADRYARSRERIRGHVEAAQRLRELPPGEPDEVAASVQSFTLGLTVQALFSPEEFPAERQERLLDSYLAALAAGQ